MEIVTGSVDERWLVGRGEGGDGGMGELKEGVGRELCTVSEGNFWCRNEIGGVTDGMVRGRKFAEGSGSEELGV